MPLPATVNDIAQHVILEVLFHAPDDQQRIGMVADIMNTLLWEERERIAMLVEDFPLKGHCFADDLSDDADDLCVALAAAIRKRNQLVVA